MAKYKFEKEDLETYFKVLSRSTTLVELETRRREMYKLIWHDRATAYNSLDYEKMTFYEVAINDLADAVLEVRKKIDQSGGEITYNPKHRKKSYART